MQIQFYGYYEFDETKYKIDEKENKQKRNTI